MTDQEQNRNFAPDSSVAASADSTPAGVCAEDTSGESGAVSDMENSGWIKLHRCLLTHWVFKDDACLRVFLYILLSATHAPRKVLFGNELIEIQPGQFTTGRFKIAENTGLSEKQVRRALKLLEKDEQLGQQISRRCSLFTVINWDAYQEKGQQREGERPVKGQSKASERATKQELKNERMEEVASSAALGMDAEIPTLAEVQKQAEMSAVTPAVAQKFWDYHQGKNLWLNKHGRPINWRHDLVVWQTRERGMVASGTPATRPPTVYELRSRIEAKEKIATDLKNRHCSEGPLGNDWHNTEAKSKYLQLRREIKDLNAQIASL